MLVYFDVSLCSSAAFLRIVLTVSDFGIVCQLCSEKKLVFGGFVRYLHPRPPCPFSGFCSPFDPVVALVTFRFDSVGSYQAMM